MKRVLYIATTANNRNRLDGETIKCRLLREYLEDIDDIQVISVDTDNWKKHIFKLVFKILINYFKCDEIVLSSADRGAHIVLSFFEKMKCKKNIYYFVIGGSLYRNIIHKKWKVTTYSRIKQIYVEAENLKDNLNAIHISNVQKLNNFRKVCPFKNSYKETPKVKFVYYGRVIKEKGIEEAIKLINRFNQENIKCSLAIYGQCKKEYLEEIQKLFSENILYHGEIKPDCKTEYEILSQYDIFIFPTEYPGECLPGALIDAYIASLAIVASDWKYAKEYIRNHENGMIFEYKNYEDMYRKTKELIASNQIAEFKKKSFELSKQYKMDEVLKDFKKEITRS